MARVLIADDEEGIRSFIGEVLEDEGHEVVLAADGQAAWEILERTPFHLLVTDLKMPRLEGDELLKRAKALYPDLEVVVLTAHGTVESAVAAMRAGAFDYLQKPLSGPAELRALVERALERHELKTLAQTQQSSADTLTWGDATMAPVVAALQKVARTTASVLLLGESGTGKEVLARALHQLSPRANQPFVAINCAALSDSLLESELFGHERGAFTGANQRRRGKLELADGGTFFLDELGELKLELQAKLLRVLELRSFERVGGSQTIQIDVRLVAATNRDLWAEVQAGRFREDLYHRLAVFPIRIPALRERPLDLLPLAETLLAKVAHQSGRPTLSLGASAREAILAYDWPGNARELKNALERAAILADSDTLSASDLFLGQTSASPRTTSTSPTSASTLAEAERQTIVDALAAVGGHRKRAAERLGIAERTLYDKIKLYQIR